MINVDVIKAAYRQTKDGFVVTFAIHPQDQHDALALADIGSQWNMQLVPLDENGNASVGQKLNVRMPADFTNAGATPSLAVGERLQHSSGETGGRPLPVSRLNAGVSTPPVRGAESNPSPPPVAPASRSFSLAQRIGAICTKPIFHQFLADVHADRWRFFTDHGNVCNSTDTDKAAEIVRSLCGVKSRADIETNPDALDRWVAVVDVFGQWQSRNPF